MLPAFSNRALGSIHCDPKAKCSVNLQRYCQLTSFDWLILQAKQRKEEIQHEQTITINKCKTKNH